MNRAAMRKELSRALATEEGDEGRDAAARTFWTRAKPVAAPVLAPGRTAQIIDLRQWSHATRAHRSPSR